MSWLAAVSRPTRWLDEPWAGNSVDRFTHTIKLSYILFFKMVTLIKKNITFKILKPKNFEKKNEKSHGIAKIILETMTKVSENTKHTENRNIYKNRKILL